jgi:hypothetical protein
MRKRLIFVFRNPQKPASPPSKRTGEKSKLPESKSNTSKVRTFATDMQDQTAAPNGVF